MIKENKDKKIISGFTLIEVMVSVGIFALVVLVSMTAVLSIVDANKKAQALDDVINNMNFSLESMVRDLRTGYEYTCSSDTTPNSISGCPSDAVNKVTFYSTISSQESGGNTLCIVTYSLDDSNPKSQAIKKSDSCGANGNLTSSNINVKRFDLYVSNNPGTQPIILMVLQATAQVGKQTTDFNLQTLISQRRLNIQ